MATPEQTADTKDRTGKAPSLRIVYGESTPDRATILIELGSPNDVRLTGKVKGPFSNYSQTLTTTTRFDSKTNYASVVITDPCFWSPLLPLHYSVEAVGTRDGQTIVEANQRFAIRRLGVRGRHLFLEGKRIVVRAIHRDHVASAGFEACRECAASIWGVTSDDHELLRDASIHGVMTVCLVEGDQRQLRQQLFSLSQWPCAAMAVLRPTEAIDRNIQEAAPNIILVASTDDNQPANSVPDWAAMVMVSDEKTKQSLSALSRETIDNVPLIAVRPSSEKQSVIDARAECDQLQADLAPDFDLAGYCV